MSVLTRHFPIFSPVAEHSILVEFGDTINHATHGRVTQLDQALSEAPFPGFVEAVPTYAALLIRFDPLLTDHTRAEQQTRHLLGTPISKGKQTALREVLVCYDDDLSPDLTAVANAAGLTVEAVIEAHLAARYDVFMYGFAPGYAYLGGVSESIQMPRKPAAVRGVLSGSVLIAGPQCLISTLTMPTGWWIIGRSPTPILTGDADRPFLFDVRDQVQFRRITRAQFESEERR